MGFAQTLTYDTSSAESIDHISKWLSVCSSEHSCTSSQMTGKLPSRVLYVGRSEVAPSFIQLFESQGTVAKYICLSHCWGISNVATTTRANFQAHKSGIRTSTLSKTFRDAIQVTRRLGIDYLWIDSLFIVQVFIRDVFLKISSPRH